MAPPTEDAAGATADEHEHRALMRRQVEASERTASYLHTIRIILLTFFIAAAVVVGLYAAALVIGVLGI